MSDEIKPEEPKKAAAPPPVLKASNEVAMILGDTLEERFRACKLYAASGMLPKGYDTPEKAFAGIQYALELGFRDKPLLAMKNIALINGQPSIWGELPQAMVLMSGKLLFFDEYFENKAGERLPETCSAEEVWAAVTIVERKGLDIGRKKFAYTQNDRTTLGVAAIWKQFTKVMMQRKARALAHKSLFADVLMGVGIAEYDHHVYLDNLEDKTTVTVLPAEDQKLKDFGAKFKKPDVEVKEPVNVDVEVDKGEI